MGLVNQAGYYAVIPADVLYDARLTPNAKLLYAVISNFCNFYGYCTCKNSTFAAFFARDGKLMSERTVERLIQTLRDSGHILSEIENMNGKTRRRIWLSCADRPDKNDGPGPDKNDGSYKNNNKYINNPPIPPKGAASEPQQKQRRARRKAGQQVELPSDLEERWDRFYAVYPVHKDKQKARERWLALAPDEEMTRMLITNVLMLQKHDPDWQKGTIPHPSTFLNNRRWEDVENLTSKPAADAAQEDGEWLE